MFNGKVSFCSEDKSRFSNVFFYAKEIVRWPIAVLATYSTLLYVAFLFYPQLIFTFNEKVIIQDNLIAEIGVAVYLTLLIVSSTLFLSELYKAFDQARKTGRRWQITHGGIKALCFIFSCPIVFTLGSIVTFKILEQERIKAQHSALTDMYFLVCLDHYKTKSPSKQINNVNDTDDDPNIAIAFYALMAEEENLSVNPFKNWAYGFYRRANDDKSILCKAIYDRIFSLVKNK